MVKKLFFVSLLLSCSFLSRTQVIQPMPAVVVPVFKNDTLNIITQGARGDGSYLNTREINQSIQQLSARGGGVVLVPKGLWLTGPLTLLSNINLHLQTGATLLFTPDFQSYPLVAGNWEGLPQMRNQSPVSASNAENIAITGNGIIDGNGDAWRMVKKDKLTQSQWSNLIERGGVLSADKKIWFPTAKVLKGFGESNPGVIDGKKTAAYYDSVKDFLRPNLLVFSNCKKILLEGVTFQNSPAWCLHPLLCSDLTVRGIRVYNPWYAQNGDGIDVESCTNVLIENSVFDVGDDALCMKSGRDEAGRKRGKATENVTIRGCTVYASHGGFVIGSEMSGGVRNINVSNCTFIGSDIGLRFKTTRGRGGVVENIFIRDIYMKDIPGDAILFDMYYAAKDPLPLAGEKRELPAVEFKKKDESTPVFRNFQISNVYVNGAARAIFVRGLPEQHIEGLQLRNMVFRSRKGIEIQEASNISLTNIRLDLSSDAPSIDLVQSDGLMFDSVSVARPPATYIRAAGERLRGINIRNPALAGVREKIDLELGAKATEIRLEGQ
ncbi:MAG: glycoside hydrolase family 28 protein [Chitinophagaceae bacterium]